VVEVPRVTVVRLSVACATESSIDGCNFPWARADEVLAQHPCEGVD
jgi:hypothetical protein